MARAADGGHERPRCTAVLLGELRVGALHEEGGAPVDKVLPGKEHAEPGLEIMVARDVVVEAETLRSASGKPHREIGQDLGEVVLEHRETELLEVGACEFETPHRPSPSPMRA